MQNTPTVFKFCFVVQDKVALKPLQISRNSVFMSVSVNIYPYQAFIGEFCQYIFCSGIHYFKNTLLQIACHKIMNWTPIFLFLLLVKMKKDEEQIKSLNKIISLFLIGNGTRMRVTICPHLHFLYFSLLKCFHDK